MNVERGNFQDLLPRIIDDINNADFIAIDSEFTGLGLDQMNKYDLLDSMEERYQKVANTIADYLPIQIGIATFKYSSESKHYQSNPYNFYIFPKCGNRFFGLDRTFTSQVSSLEFLESHEFNFQKWISQGVSFVNHHDEDRIQAKLDAMVETDEPLKEGDTLYEYSVGCVAQVRDFLQNSTEKMMVIKTPSTYHKRIVHQTISREFNGYVGCQSKRTVIELTKLTEEERQAALGNSKKNQLKQELNELIGFRNVVDAISKAKVPVVGHNLFLDLCYFYHNFYKPLPKSFVEFKEEAHFLFPFIFDTKYVASTNSAIQSYIRNTVLGDLFESMSQSEFKNLPLVVFGTAFESYASASFHEAGYDAYMTGVIFLKMLAKEQKQEKSGQIIISSKYENKIFIMNSCYPCLCLTSETNEPDYSNVFKLSGFPAGWKIADIQQNVKELGHIYVRWIDDRSCFLIIKKEAIAIALGLCSKKNEKFTLQPIESPPSLKRKFDSDSDMEQPTQQKRKKQKCIIS